MNESTDITHLLDDHIYGFTWKHINLYPVCDMEKLFPFPPNSFTMYHKFHFHSICNGCLQILKKMFGEWYSREKPKKFHIKIFRIKNKDFNANQIAQGKKTSEDQCCAEYRLYKA